jgi:uncharacterized repeat protein (TIGR03803 family)
MTFVCVRTTRIWRAALVIAAVLTTPLAAQAQEDYVVLHEFPGGQSGFGPTTPLIRAADGKIYVGTSAGLHAVDASGTPVPINDFSVESETVLASDGYLYMVSPTGISRMPLDGGPPTVLHAISNPPEIYRMTPAGALGTVVELGPPGDPQMASLAKGIDGNFYGTTWRTGPGSLFRLTADGRLSAVHVFQTDSPTGFPLQASDGTIYGTTAGGNGEECGSVYKVDTDRTFTTLYRFSLAALDGCSPSQTLVLGTDGALYGVTSNTIFQLTTWGSFRLLHRADYPGGNNRYGIGYRPLLEGPTGDFYGVAAGGLSGNSGGIFRLNRRRVPCVNDLDLLWQGSPDGSGWLYLIGAVKSETPALWTTLFLSQAGISPLWKVVTPTIDPTYAYEIGSQLSGGIGTIAVFTIVVTSSGNVCADWSTAETGGIGATADELRQMLPQGLPRPSP